MARDPSVGRLVRRGIGAALLLGWATVLLAPAASVTSSQHFDGATMLSRSVVESVRRVGNGGRETLMALVVLVAVASNAAVLAAVWRLTSLRPSGLARPSRRQSPGRSGVAALWRLLSLVALLAALGCGVVALWSPLTLRWGYGLWLVCVLGATLSLWLPRVR